MVPIIQIFVCRITAFCSWKGPGLHVFGEHSGSYIWIRVWLLFQKFTAKHFIQIRVAPLQMIWRISPRSSAPFPAVLDFCSPSMLRCPAAYLQDIKPRAKQSWPLGRQAGGLTLFLGRGGKTVQAISCKCHSNGALQSETSSRHFLHLTAPPPTHTPKIAGKIIFTSWL